MPEFIFDQVETNITKGSVLWNRLEQVNALLEKPIVIREFDYIEDQTFINKIFKKQHKSLFEVIHRVNENQSVLIIAECTKREAELYLLGLLNGYYNENKIIYKK